MLHVSVPAYKPKPPSSCIPGAITHEVTPLSSLVVASMRIVPRSSTETEPSPPPTTTSPEGTDATAMTPFGTRDLCGPACLKSCALRLTCSTSPEVVPTYMYSSRVRAIFEWFEGAYGSDSRPRFPTDGR